MWVVTSAGVDAFRRVPVSVISTHQGLPSDTVESVLPTSDGAVWIGGTGLTKLVGDRIERLSAADPFAGGDITSMLQDHAGRLWIGLNNTLNVLDGGRVVRIAGPQGGDTGAIEFMKMHGTASGPRRSVLARSCFGSPT